MPKGRCIRIHVRPKGDLPISTYLALRNCNLRPYARSDVTVGRSYQTARSDMTVGRSYQTARSDVTVERSYQKKQDLLEGTERLLYSGAWRSRRLYLSRRLQGRPDDTRKLIQLGMRRYRRVVYRSTCKTQGSMQKIGRKKKS